MKDSKLKNTQELSEQLSIDAQGRLKVDQPKTSLSLDAIRLHPLDIIISCVVVIIVAINAGAFIILRHSVFYYLQPDDTQSFLQAWEIVGTVLGMMNVFIGFLIYLVANAYFAQLLPKKIVID